MTAHFRRTRRTAAVLGAALVFTACAEAEIPIVEVPIVIELPGDTGWDTDDDDTHDEDIDAFDDDTDGGYTLIPDAVGPPDVVVEPDVDPCPATACTIGMTECVSPSRIRECIADVEGCGGWTVARACPDGGLCENNVCKKCIDEDGDGYGEGCLLGPDCDDGDPHRNPGAVEVCDGRDNDCNGIVDDGIDCTTCADDTYEPNNTSTTGTPLAVGQSFSMTLCPLDIVDWFRLGTYDQGDTVSVEILFNQSLGDLDMEMFVGSSYETGSYSSTSNESITRVLSRAGNVSVRVIYKTSHTPRDAGTPYTIRR
jgi:hypothetical protein